VGEREVLDGYGEDEECTSGRGQVLIPWPNRIEDGTYEFDGERHQLPLTEPGRRNAIHGLVRGEPWTVAAHERSRVLMTYSLELQPGYPFALALELEYSLSDDGLRMQTTATNLGDEVAPYGSGAHPYRGRGRARWIRRPCGYRPAPCSTRTIAGCRSPASPSRARNATSAARPIGATVLDHAFTDLERGDDGLARVELAGLVSLWVDPSFPYLMVFTGDPLPDVARRSIAVEPMTCPPNAFRSGEGVIRLEPGETARGTWGITPSG
jgi:aldose 1-epimerase